MGERAHADLVDLARQGDQAAFAELVRRFEPEVRRFIRLKLTDPALCRRVDDSDIFQSVLANFYVKLRAGDYDLQEPSNLAALLTVLARNKIIDHARKPAVRRGQSNEAALLGLLDSAETPSVEMAIEELLARARQFLNGEELLLIEWRKEGKEWPEIAALRGCSAEAARKRYERAVSRVREQLGLGEDDG